jgi:Ca-activated chloride channel family protein
MQTSVRVDYSLLAVESEHHVHAMLEVVAPDAGNEKRPALNVALVIDRSGSMSGPKLEGAKNAARFLVSRLGPDDTLALVTFENSVELLAASARPDKALMGAVIDRIGTGGMTNLSGGWLKGVEELRRVPDGGQRRVLLLTDGYANVGVTNQGKLNGMAEGLREERITTSTIGFGDEFDEDLLFSLATAAGGNAYFAEGPEDAAKIFNEEFDGLASVASQNVSVEITPRSDVKLLGVLHEFPTRSVPGGLQVELGDFYGGENRRVVFEFAIPNVAELGEKHIADVVLRYTSVGDAVEMHQVTMPVYVNIVAAADAEGVEADRDVIDEVTIIKAAEDRRRAIELAEQRRHEEAAQLLEERRRVMEERRQYSSRPDEFASEVDELGYSSDKLRRGEYDAATKKQLELERWRARQSRKKPDWENPDDKEKW